MWVTRHGDGSAPSVITWLLLRALGPESSLNYKVWTRTTQKTRLSPTINYSGTREIK